MNLRSAAFFALVGMAMLTILLTWNLVVNFLGVMRGYIPDMALLTSFVQWLDSVSLLVFFAVFQRER